MEFFRAECKDFSFFKINSLHVLFSNAGGRIVSLFGLSGFLLGTSWFGEKPLSFVIEFLALSAQATAIPKSQLVAVMVLVTVKHTTVLCRSISPLLPGLSTEVVQILILKSLQNVIKIFICKSVPIIN